MVLGNYYLTLERKDAVNTGAIFNDTNEVLKLMQMAMFIYTLVLVYMQIIQQPNIHRCSKQQNFSYFSR